MAVRVRAGGKAWGIAVPRLRVASPAGIAGLPAAIRLPSVPGALDIDEDTLQEQVVAHFRRALAPGSLFYMNDNVQRVGSLSKQRRGMVHASLKKRGLLDGLLDLTAVWNPGHRLCPGPGRGAAWIELKRPVKPPPVTADQAGVIEALRALGFVAGAAQTVEQVEALLIEANAPLQWRLPTRPPP